MTIVTEIGKILKTSKHLSHAVRMKKMHVTIF